MGRFLNGIMNASEDFKSFELLTIMSAIKPSWLFIQVYTLKLQLLYMPIIVCIQELMSLLARALCWKADFIFTDYGIVWAWLYLE